MQDTSKSLSILISKLIILVIMMSIEIVKSLFFRLHLSCHAKAQIYSHPDISWSMIKEFTTCLCIGECFFLKICNPSSWKLAVVRILVKIGHLLKKLSVFIYYFQLYLLQCKCKAVAFLVFRNGSLLTLPKLYF